MKPFPKSRCWLSLAVALALALGLAAIGCADLDTAEGTTGTMNPGSLPGVTTTEVQATTTTVAAPTTTSGSSATASHTPVTNTSSESVAPDGHIKACGIIKEVWVDGGVRKIKIDYVDYLTGAAAVAAAAAEGEQVEDGYWVKNDNPKLRTFTVSSSVAITLDDRSLPPGHLVPLTWTEFSDGWKLSGEEAVLRWSLWWIERSGTTVVRIDQQFQP
jgi:hypothetical protein